MSSFYDDASLVVIPSGYKTSKVYAEKPTDGSGDLAFTRTGDTATRVNSAGLIEKVRTNLILQSQTFDNASWVKSNITVTANSTNAPDGTATADTILAPTTSVNAIYQAISTSGVLTLSIYAKANTSNFIFIDIFDFSPAVDYVAIFDLSNGTYVGNGGFSNVDSYNIQNVGNGWYRISATKDLGASGNHNFIYGVSNGSGLTTTAGTSVFVWGAQLEATDFGATPYILTTTSAVSVGPVANVPRLDYLGSTCPRLLLEPQRTNLGLWSEQFNNAGWTNAATTITANYGVSPDGYTNADRFQQTAIGALQQTISVTASTAYTVSFYCKLLGGTSASLGVYNFSASNFIFQDNLFSSLVLNQWVRITRTFTTPVGCTSITGELWRDSTIDCLVYGFQMEAGAYSTSLIPTLAASATRGADACSKTGISSLIGQTEGTIYCEVDMQNLDKAPQQFLELHQDANNRFGIAAFWDSFASVNRMQLYQFFGGGLEVNIQETITSGVLKVAAAYKANDYVLYINGVQIGTDTSASVPATSIIYIGSNGSTFFVGNGVKQSLLFKTRLTNAELAELTTL